MNVTGLTGTFEAKIRKLMVVHMVDLKYNDLNLSTVFWGPNLASSDLQGGRGHLGLLGIGFGGGQGARGNCIGGDLVVRRANKEGCIDRFCINEQLSSVASVSGLLSILNFHSRYQDVFAKSFSISTLLSTRSHYVGPSPFPLAQEGSISLTELRCKHILKPLEDIDGERDGKDRGPYRLLKTVSVLLRLGEVSWR